MEEEYNRARKKNGDPTVAAYEGFFTQEETHNPNHFPLFKTPYQYSIPGYQRPYTWGKNSVTSLLDSFLHAQGIIRLNGMVFHPVINGGQLRSYEVIDGQQRLTTISIILAAIHHILQEKEGIHAGICPTQPGEEALLGAFSKGRSVWKNYRPRIVFGDTETQKALDSVITGTLRSIYPLVEEAKKTPEGKRGASQRVYTNFEAVIKALEKENTDTLLSLLETIKGRTIVTITILEGQENPARTYASQNTGGVVLQDNEIIKSLFWSEAQKEEELGQEYEVDISAFWGSRDTPEKQNLLDIASRAIAYSLLLQVGAQSDKADKDYIRDWGQIMGSLPLESVWGQFVEGVELFELATCPLNGVDYQDRRLKLALETIYALTQSTPVFGFALMLGEKLPEEEFLEAVLLLERYFLNVALCKPTSITAICVTFRSKSWVWGQGEVTLGGLRSFLEKDILTTLNKWWSADEFYQAVESKTYSAGREGKPLTVAMNWLHNQQMFESGNPGRLISLYDGKITREHVLPQNPSWRSSLSESERISHDYHMALMGNSIPVMGEVNSQAQNKPPVEKLPVYRDRALFQHTQAVNEVIRVLEEEGKFGEEQIRERTELLALDFAQRLAPDNPSLFDPHSPFLSPHRKFHLLLTPGETISVGGKVLVFTEDGFFCPEGEPDRKLKNIKDVSDFVGLAENSVSAYLKRISEELSASLLEEANPDTVSSSQPIQAPTAPQLPLGDF